MSNEVIAAPYRVRVNMRALVPQQILHLKRAVMNGQYDRLMLRNWSPRKLTESRRW